MKNCPCKSVRMRNLRRLSHSGGRMHGSLNGAVLTVRELEVMRLAAEGLTNKTIARQLRVSEGTIKLHLHHIYRKLGIKSRFALAAVLHKKVF
jgi:DNA-binding NarL/FixJ family response regulator